MPAKHKYRCQRSAKQQARDARWARARYVYDKATGEVRNAVDVRAGANGNVVRARKGDRAGSINGKGYLQLRFRGVLIMGTHVIWLIVTGRWPVLEIDHIDTDPSNNRWKNLRESDCFQQAYNRTARADNALGTKCVRKTRGGRFELRISATYSTLATAIEVHRRVAEVMHGAFVNTKGRAGASPPRSL